MSDFIHLHNHTDYSLLDAAQSIDMMCNRMSDIGMDTIAVTEHGNLIIIKSWRELSYNKCQKPLYLKNCTMFVTH